MNSTRHCLQDPDTAPMNLSIWTDVERNALECHAQMLFKRQHIADRRCYIPSPRSRDDLYPLPRKVEESLADDFAFIAASQPKVGFVTAATIEQIRNKPSLLVKLAANEGVSAEVNGKFDDLFEVLRKRARKEINRESCQTQVYDLIVNLNCNRILGRLGSTWFQPPPHLLKTREPLPTRLRRLFRTNLQASLRRTCPDFSRLDEQIRGFEQAFERLERGNTQDVVRNVALIIKQAFDLTEDGVKLPARVQALGCPATHLDARDIREVGKVANYWRISRHLTICSWRFRTYFSNAAWLPVPGYRCSTTSNIQSQQFVHAEIQLLVHYELASPHLMPRTIEISKQSRFLCDSFIQAHGQFSITGAHRQMFPQWTIPDLEEYNAQTTQRFRVALKQVLVDVRKEILRSEKTSPWRPIPLQSAINLQVVHFPTPSDSSYSAHHGEDASEGFHSTGTGDHSTTSIPSQQEPDDVENNIEDSMEETRASRTPIGHRQRLEAEEVPVSFGVDFDTDWVRVFAAISTLQQRYTGGRIILEAAIPGEQLQKVQLTDLSETEEILLESCPGDDLQELSFLLVGLGGKQMCVRCLWHLS